MNIYKMGSGLSWYGDLANRFMETSAGKVLGSVGTRIAEHAVGKLVGKLAGPAGLVYEAVTGGIREDFANGNYLSAGAKVAGLALGAAALVAVAAGSAPVAAALGTASLVVGIAPDVVAGTIDGLRDAGVIAPAAPAAPASGGAPPASTVVPMSNNVLAASPTTYAAVDTTRLTAGEQQPPAEPVAKDPKEKSVAEPSVVQQTASRPTPAISPVA